MQRIRLVVFVVTVSILSIGYFASQFAYFKGSDAVQNYYLQVSSPTISALTLLLLVGIIVLAVLNVRDHKDKEE